MAEYIIQSECTIRFKVCQNGAEWSAISYSSLLTASYGIIFLRYAFFFLSRGCREGNGGCDEGLRFIVALPPHPIGPGARYIGYIVAPSSQSGTRDHACILQCWVGGVSRATQGKGWARAGQGLAKDRIKAG